MQLLAEHQLKDWKKPDGLYPDDTCIEFTYTNYLKGKVIANNNCRMAKLRELLLYQAKKKYFRVKTTKHTYFTKYDITLRQKATGLQRVDTYKFRSGVIDFKNLCKLYRGNMNFRHARQKQQVFKAKVVTDNNGSDVIGKLLCYCCKF